MLIIANIKLVGQLYSSKKAKLIENFGSIIFFQNNP